MSGDMKETLGLLSDRAGIIPRVLHTIFNTLGADECVKCSFVELYNEELRDLIAPEDGPQLKIHETSWMGHTTTVIQGIEEKHIKTASEGTRVLQEGSLRRQVAATNCNDLSSRSHTVFTITAYMCRKGEDGVEEYVSAGKLNLVDLAGSENIQRSGTENKRATEAGLINKSLLTLGRVINALVDRNRHIPYRESKLTRLLQDSLGGRTKTCIIATVATTKTDLEETTSTLDYAFRAKNIRNQPQPTMIFNKKILLKELATEIEKLESELVITRQRNGMHLSDEAYDEITNKNESLRTLMEEHAAKVELIGSNLRNKTQDLFMLTSTLSGLKRDHAGTDLELDKAKDVLSQTEVVLDSNSRALVSEARIHKAHQGTEENLVGVGSKLIDTLQRTIRDIAGLHSRGEQTSHLQSINHTTWVTAQTKVSEMALLVEQRAGGFQSRQRQQLGGLSDLEELVSVELHKLSSIQKALCEDLRSVSDLRGKLVDQTKVSKNRMQGVLNDISVLQDTVTHQVEQSLHATAAAAKRFDSDALDEIGTLQNHVKTPSPLFKLIQRRR